MIKYEFYYIILIHSSHSKAIFYEFAYFIFLILRLIHYHSLPTNPIGLLYHQVTFIQLIITLSPKYNLISGRSYL